MVLRLDPSLPVLWRSPTSLQLGVRPVVVFDDVSDAQERLIAALATGVTPAGLTILGRSLELDDEAVSALLARLEPALETPPTRLPRAAVTGEGPLAAEVAGQLREASALVAADDAPDVVAVVTPWIVAPEDHGRWLSRDVAHLPVVESAGAVTVGPAVLPGQSACLYCVHLTRCDDDPAWPALATQLWGRERPANARRHIAEVAAFAVRRLLGGPEPGREWTLAAATGDVSVRDWRPHPECLCAAQPGSDWARDAAPASPSAPRTAKAVAGRA